LLAAAGRRRSPVTMPGYHAGRPPGNKGMHYPADPPTVDEIVAVMRHTADDRHGYRLRGMIVVLWRAGLRVQESLALAEHDLDLPGWLHGLSCRPDRSSASSMGAPGDGRGRQPRCAPSCGGSPPGPE
jgi:hypothetical protein